MTFIYLFTVIIGLKEKFDEATRREDVKAIVLTGEFVCFGKVHFLDS